MADKQTVEAEMEQILYSLAKKANKAAAVMFSDIKIGKEMWVEAFNEAEAQLNQLLIKELIKVREKQLWGTEEEREATALKYVADRIAELKNQLGEKS